MEKAPIITIVQKIPEKSKVRGDNGAKINAHTREILPINKNPLNASSLWFLGFRPTKNTFLFGLDSISLFIFLSLEMQKKIKAKEREIITNAAGRLGV